MRGLALVAVLVSAAVVAGVAPAQTGDAVYDGTTHPNVGALLRKRTNGTLAIVCTGTLVSPRVFLTAGHCTSFLESIGQSRAYVSFDPDFGLNNGAGALTSTPNVGDVITNPRYKNASHDDTGIVVLDAGVAGIAPARLAPVGYLDGLKKDGTIEETLFTNVGYGSSEKVVDHGPTFPFDGLRKWTVSAFSALNPGAVHLNQQLKKGWAGTCFGDSGGPTFVDTASGAVQVSVVSTGDIPCGATSVNARTDTAEVHTWLSHYLGLT